LTFVIFLYIRQFTAT